MNNQMLDISVLSASDIDINLLLDFYNAVYPELPIRNIWKWLYRVDFYDKKTPLVLVKDNRVIAHAGMIPFKVSIGNESYNASWFVDFAVLPDFQRLGLGTLLTEKWMEFSDIYVTFCNEKSMGIFKKYGWVESFETYMLRFFLKPFNRPKLAKLIPYFPREFLNFIFSPIPKMIYRRYSLPLSQLQVQPLNEKSIVEFMAGLKVPSQGVIPDRDYDYISWRLLESPDKKNYFIVSCADIKCVMKAADKKSPAYIDILWVSDPSKYSSLRGLIATIAMWAMSKGYSYIRYYESEKELTRFLRENLKPIVSHPRFAFFSKNRQLLSLLKEAGWNWCLMDSDFEAFQK